MSSAIAASAAGRVVAWSNRHCASDGGHDGGRGVGVAVVEDRVRSLRAAPIVAPEPLNLLKLRERDARAFLCDVKWKAMQRPSVVQHRRRDAERAKRLEGVGGRDGGERRVRNAAALPGPAPK